MKTQIVYKVVRYYGKSGYLSAFVSVHDRQYRLGETVTNEKMPLFAFDTLENARAFRHFNHVILKCNAVISSMQPKLRADTCYDQFDLFWKQIKNYKKITAYTCQKVIGTIFCSSITPLEMVK
jgi:hypothetical protein